MFISRSLYMHEIGFKLYAYACVDIILAQYIWHIHVRVSEKYFKLKEKKKFLFQNLNDLILGRDCNYTYENRKWRKLYIKFQSERK